MADKMLFLGELDGSQHAVGFVPHHVKVEDAVARFLETDRNPRRFVSWITIEYHGTNGKGAMVNWELIS